MIGRVGVAGAGFVAPGICDAAALYSHLDGSPLSPVEGWRPAPATLPARQARRVSSTIALAIAAAEQIGAALPADAGWVFASALGEGETLNEILAALSRPEIMVQPLKFQNAVHNAAQGQWSILVGARAPATSIAAHDETAGAGLLKAAMQVLLEGKPVGLVSFDTPLPPPLHEKKPIDLAMAAALALTPEHMPGTIGTIELEVLDALPMTDPAESGASPLLVDSGNPVRFLLPLFERMHRADERPIALALSGGSVLRASYHGAGIAG